MRKKNWRGVQAYDLRHAIELCIEHARDRHNRSIEQVADLIDANKWTLYKWIESGAIPANKIKPIEFACGVDFISRYLVVTSGKLVIDIPKGRRSGPDDMQVLQVATHDAVGALMKFYNDQADAKETLASVQTAMESLAWHKTNVEKTEQPELPFDMGEP